VMAKGRNAKKLRKVAYKKLIRTAKEVKTTL